MLSRRWVGGGWEPHPLATSPEGNGGMRIVGVVVAAWVGLLTGVDKFGLLLSFFFFFFLQAETLGKI